MEGVTLSFWSSRIAEATNVQDIRSATMGCLGRTRTMAGLTSVDLFAGAGGLSLGIHQVGFRHVALVEFNRHACATLRLNAEVGVIAPPWPVIERDVRDVDYGTNLGAVDLDVLAAGAPCQPFSLGGRHRGDEDGRNMFPQVFRAVRALRPKAVILENVRGLKRQSFRPYFEYILLQLEMPHLPPHEGEEWWCHKERLLVLQRTLPMLDREATYDVHERLLNSADYGVPQRRERVIMVAFRRDLEVEWECPKSSYSEGRLLYEQYVTGEYWLRHGLPVRSAPPELANRVSRLAMVPPEGQAWGTLRDALAGLPEPVEGRSSEGPSFHIGIPGARVYKGHTGNKLDYPAKTIKAGDHGNPGGEHILIRDDGSLRYLTVRECARVQAYPDEYLFAGSRTEAMRQIGNAVPVTLGRAVARSVKAALGATQPAGFHVRELLATAGGD